MNEKIIEVAGKTAVTGGGALVGGAGGAAIGTLICPGIGTAIGYLLGIGGGTAKGLKLGKKWFG
ncbi:hypothetical protein ACQKLN_17175 [Paenibacillus glucanolyticus]|uniref:hypothetical protein n=1 Tax=Paenibacillus glucanolyticus TaxID=59843 RepID=UPI0036A9A7D8